jgi:hypothetical protein
MNLTTRDGSRAGRWRWSCVELRFAEKHGYIQEIKEASRVLRAQNYMIANTNTEAQEVKKKNGARGNQELKKPRT